MPSGAEAADDVAELRTVEERLRSTADALLVGRRTFEDFRSYWPHQNDDATGVRDYLNSVQKYVVSSTLSDPNWDHTTVLTGDVADEVTALKAQDGGDIVVTGSVTLVQSLNQLRLVDEYRLFVYPVTMTRGRRLFDEPDDRRDLELVEAHPFRTGVVLLRYRVH